jgi:hypothetical protein
MFSMTRNLEPGQGLARKLTLAIATIVLLACVGISPAKAWYDTRGYWHPDQYAYYDDQYRARRAAEQHYWCERHPSACGYAPRYRYYEPRYRYYQPGYGYYQPGYGYYERGYWRDNDYRR